jgi:prophage antirepressor-like protein
MMENKRITALMDLRNCTDHITFDVKGVEGQVRVVGTYEAPWFNGLDVCTVLGYSNCKDALRKHTLQHQKKSLSLLCSEVGGPSPPTSLGSGHFQNLTHNEGKAVYINESGFYRLINKSKTRLSDAFQEIVCDYVLPTLRQHGSVSVEGIQRQLEDLKLEQQNQAQIIEHQAAALADEEDKRKRAERKSLRISKLMKHASIKEKKEEWIYIATTDIYSRDRIFKIGSTERLVRRIDGYQTGRPKEDQYYYAYLKKVYASKDLDYHIQRLLSDFKHNEKGEMYIGIKFEDLCNILTVICDNYDRSLDYVYGFVKARLPESQEEGEDEPPPV